ncbi:flagellar protein FliT [Neptunomonas phycophila]|uniref:flagellar protein FliT n=1 Tax=Neptunomonas phycophila TaxID=1572645 RepID=UPI001BE60C14|nr:flagellar protein FliT [Neptunomonas phycophila]MBT3144382.1 flagellar protein FliT [Neptunomonas phycophila]MDO6785624.1 flagellar protein FliT [Neptunomonas phycophila]
MINLLEQLFELTRNLKDASLSGDWDSVLNIQRQREALCQTLENMEKPDSATQGDEIRRLIQAIQSLENEVMPLIKSQKKNIVEQRSTQNKGKKMTKAYKGI